MGLGVAAILACAPVYANAPPAAYRSAMTNAQLLACADAEFRRADIALNAAYRLLAAWLAALDAQAADGADRVGRLRQPQRAWIAFRDAQCLLDAAAMFGGSGAPLTEIGCRTGLTEERTRAIATITGIFAPT